MNDREFSFDFEVDHSVERVMRRTATDKHFTVTSICKRLSLNQEVRAVTMVVGHNLVIRDRVVELDSAITLLVVAHSTAIQIKTIDGVINLDTLGVHN